MWLCNVDSGRAAEEVQGSRLELESGGGALLKPQGDSLSGVRAWLSTAPQQHRQGSHVLSWCTTAMGRRAIAISIALRELW